MATKKTGPKNDERAAMKRYVDQPGQWVDTTPARLKAQQRKAMDQLMASLTPAQRKQMGLPTKGGKK